MTSTAWCAGGSRPCPPRRCPSSPWPASPPSWWTRGWWPFLATGTARVTGAAFPALAPLVGAVGSFLTGSTTSSNALFAVLQYDIAGLLNVDPTLLLAAQTAGGNVGNALAPVVIVIGLAAIGRLDATSEVLRTAIGPAAVLLAAMTLLTVLAVILT